MPRPRAPALAPVLAAVAAAALLVRGQALVPDPTPDAVEYQLIARSLARGDGFALPVRVRHGSLDAPAPVVHDARGERAPLLPLALAGLELLGADAGGGRVATGLQAANALVSVLDALLVALLAARLAPARVRRSLALAAGLAVAWSPPLVQASCRILAEPLGLACVLLAAHAEVGLARARDARRAAALAFVSGLALVLARLARPETEAVLALVALARVVSVVRAGRSGALALARRRHAAALAGTLAALGADALVARAGFPPPQSDLLRVGHYRALMFDWTPGAPPAASALTWIASHAGEVAGQVAANLADMGHHALRYATALPLLAAIALVRARRPAARLVLLALAFVLVAGSVWSTRDHARFLVIPLALLAAPGVLEGARLLRRFARGRERGPGARPPAARRARLRARLALVAAGLVAAPLLVGDVRATWHAIARARAPEADSAWGGPELDALAARLRALPEGRAFAAVSPWTLALASGRAGVLLPVHLGRGEVAAFLARWPEVSVVVLRPESPHDRITPEPTGYLEELAAIGSRESVGRSEWIRLR